MNAQIFSEALGEISEKYIEESLTYQCPTKRPHTWLKRCIAACLVVALCFGALLATSETASAAFLGWLKETYEMFSAYRSPTTGDTLSEVKEYQLGWIPDGYSRVSVNEMNGSVITLYADEEGQQLTFTYINDSSSCDLFVDTPQVTKHKVEVNGCAADLFISDSPDISNGIVWINEHNIAIYISAFLDGDELIRLAESVTEAD